MDFLKEFTNLMKNFEPKEETKKSDSDFKKRQDERKEVEKNEKKL